MGALASVRELVTNDEAEIAVDYLINTINSFRADMRAARAYFQARLDAEIDAGCWRPRPSPRRAPSQKPQPMPAPHHSTATPPPLCLTATAVSR